MQGPTEFTETLNRITIISLAITIKTRGIAEVEHMIYLQPLLEQIMAASQHTWSEKTLRYFPPLIRDFLMGRMDKRGQAIQAWQQVSFYYLLGWVFDNLYVFFNASMHSCTTCSILMESVKISYLLLLLEIHHILSLKVYRMILSVLLWLIKWENFSAAIDKIQSSFNASVQ